MDGVNSRGRVAEFDLADDMNRFRVCKMEDCGMSENDVQIS